MSRSEAARIYMTIFNTNVPEQIEKHFEITSKKIENLFSEEEVKKYFESIERVRDLEALELAARYLKRIPLLTEKFKIMVCLAETLPENYNKYINERDNRFLGYLLLICAGFRSIYKFVKGLFLLMVYKP